MKKDQLDAALADCTKRTCLITSLIEAMGYTSYLEIGCRKDETFSAVKCYKVGVDPIEGGTHRLTSDEFFAQNGAIFDAIFIDGDHHHDQVYRDATNALHCLSPNGTLIMHDCSPPYASYEGKRDWKCGTAWRGFAKLRERPGLDCIVADWDYGSGMIRFSSGAPGIVLGKTMDELTYADFEAHKHDWMLLSTRQQIADWIWKRANQEG